MRSEDGSLHTDQSAALIACAEDLPLAMRRRPLTEARHFSLLLAIFTRHCRWSVKSTNRHRTDSELLTNSNSIVRQRAERISICPRSITHVRRIAIVSVGVPTRAYFKLLWAKKAVIPASKPTPNTLQNLARLISGRHSPTTACIPLPFGVQCYTTFSPFSNSPCQRTKISAESPK